MRFFEGKITAAYGAIRSTLAETREQARPGRRAPGLGAAAARARRRGGSGAWSSERGVSSGSTSFAGTMTPCARCSSTTEARWRTPPATGSLCHSTRPQSRSSAPRRCALAEQRRPTFRRCRAHRGALGGSDPPWLGLQRQGSSCRRQDCALARGGEILASAATTALAGPQPTSEPHPVPRCVSGDVDVVSIAWN
jgi:hypothetical protein